MFFSPSFAREFMFPQSSISCPRHMSMEGKSKLLLSMWWTQNLLHLMEGIVLLNRFSVWKWSKQNYFVPKDYTQSWLSFELNAEAGCGPFSWLSPARRELFGFSCIVFDLPKDGGQCFQILATGSSTPEANIEKHFPFHRLVSILHFPIVAGT